MSNLRWLTCLVPSIWWDEAGPQPEIKQLVVEALAIERRLPKQVDMERERLRHIACCQQIEEIVRAHSRLVVENTQLTSVLQSGQVAAVKLDGSYLDHLEDIVAAAEKDPRWSSSRFGSNFFPPQSIEGAPSLMEYLSQFESLTQALKLNDNPSIIQRTQVLREAVQRGCGVVELLDIYNADTNILVQEVQPSVREPVSLAQLVAAKSKQNVWVALSEQPSLTEGERRSQRSLMQAEIERALSHNQVVNFNNYRNDVITDTLHHSVYVGNPNQPRMLNVVYGDGSQARPFPLCSLPTLNEMRKAPFRNTHPLRIAMLSIRHLEMDREVDMAWFRNSEASLRRTSYADADDFCYRETLRQLTELKKGDVLLIHLYQTGLEPAVVGFYRGLVDFLRLATPDSPRVAIIPMYYRGEGLYAPGSMWA